MTEGAGTSENVARYACHFENCQASFCRPSRLKHHIRVHTGERPFQCGFPDCHKSYTRAFHLKRHVAASHQVKTYSEVFQCRVHGCNQTFTLQQNLLKHSRTVHKKQQFKCKFCHRAFRKHQHLRVHEYDHTGVKPFVCDHEGCGKAFVVPSKLKTHRKIHEKYQCEVDGCGQLLANWTQLQKHKKLEHQRSFRCHLCCREFLHKSQLRVHVTVHQEKREVFHCPHEKCPRYYYYERNLCQHIRAAHEGKLHVCPHSGCGKKLSTKQRLQQHQKLHDPVRPVPKPRQKKRKTRKDKGSVKSSMALKLSGFYISADTEERLGTNETFVHATVCEQAKVDKSPVGGCDDKIEGEVDPVGCWLPDSKLSRLSGEAEKECIAKYLNGAKGHWQEEIC